MIKQKKEEVKEIPVKNYLVLGVIIIITLLASLYIFAWLRQYNDSKVNTPIITSTLREVQYNNLNTVVKERDILVMYMCTTDEDICRNFEKKFAKRLSTLNPSLAALTVIVATNTRAIIKVNNDIRFIFILFLLSLKWI